VAAGAETRDRLLLAALVVALGAVAQSREAAGNDPRALAAYLEAARLDPLDGDAAVNAGAAARRGLPAGRAP
jgi:hypothetical protein